MVVAQDVTIIRDGHEQTLAVLPDPLDTILGQCRRFQTALLAIALAIPCAGCDGHGCSGCQGLIDRALVTLERFDCRAYNAAVREAYGED